MPQTIALQRGTTTVTGNGTDSVTLFTQSGGTATRVILNQLGAYFSADFNQTTSVAVFHNVSGGQSFLLGLLRDSDRRRSCQFAPGAATNNAFAGNVGQTAAGTFEQRSMMPSIGSGGTSGVGSAAANAVVIEYYGTTTANAKFAIFPSNFYMGPGDSISVKVLASTDDTARTANISYSFTTITES